MALERYKKVCPDGVESLVSCSDDFTLYLWRSNSSKCITRMTGHQNVVNDVKYSPDVKYVNVPSLVIVLSFLFLFKDTLHRHHSINRFDYGMLITVPLYVHSVDMYRLFTRLPGQLIHV